MIRKLLIVTSFTLLLCNAVIANRSDVVFKNDSSENVLKSATDFYKKLDLSLSFQIGQSYLFKGDFSPYRQFSILKGLGERARIGMAFGVLELSANSLINYSGQERVVTGETNDWLHTYRTTNTIENIDLTNLYIRQNAICFSYKVHRLVDVNFSVISNKVWYSGHNVNRVFIDSSFQYLDTLLIEKKRVNYTVTSDNYYNKKGRRWNEFNINDFISYQAGIDVRIVKWLTFSTSLGFGMGDIYQSGVPEQNRVLIRNLTKQENVPKLTHLIVGLKVVI
ncbi:MAG: hypothetical protein ACPGLV_13055 [Bacteroidia bacterium]